LGRCRSANAHQPRGVATLSLPDRTTRTARAVLCATISGSSAAFVDTIFDVVGLSPSEIRDRGPRPSRGFGRSRDKCSATAKLDVLAILERIVLELRAPAASTDAFSTSPAVPSGARERGRLCADIRSYRHVCHDRHAPGFLAICLAQASGLRSPCRSWLARFHSRLRSCF